MAAVRVRRSRLVRWPAALAVAALGIALLAPTGAGAVDRRTSAPAATRPAARLAAGRPAIATATQTETETETATATDGARVVAQTPVAANLVDLTISSPALAGDANVRLLTPDGWNRRRPGPTWPVLWLLAGCCGDYTAWSTLTDVASLPQLRHTLVVMPEGGNIGWYSNWWNDGAGGAPGWETFHLTELRQILERGYGAGSHRVVAGLSMGGFGAMSYAARHPGLFRAAASYSGVVHPLYADGGPANIAEINAGYGVTDTGLLWGDPVAQRRIWAAHDPYTLAGRLRHIPVFLSCGNGQPGPLDKAGTGVSAFEVLFSAENAALAPRLRAAGVRLTTDFYGPGTHSWPYWQRELHRSLPMLLHALR